MKQCRRRQRNSSLGTKCPEMVGAGEALSVLLDRCAIVLDPGSWEIVRLCGDPLLLGRIVEVLDGQQRW